LLLLIIAVMVAEVYVIVQVAHHIGVLATLALLVVISASGPWLVRRTGLGVWRRAQGRLQDGEVPGREIVEGVILLAAGVLLTVPGFITGVVGALLLLPPARALVRLLGGRWLARRVVVQQWSDGGQGSVVTAGSRTVDRRPAGDQLILDRPAQSPAAGPAGSEPSDEPRRADRPDRAAGS
jgi:UPF0716 protein FxsA